MALFISFLLAIVMSLHLATVKGEEAVNSTDFPVPQVIGGKEVPEGRYPFMVSLEWFGQDGKGFHFCGGSIINDDTILTAAHCVKGHNPTEMFAYIGGNNIDGVQQSQTIKGASSHVHESFNGNQMNQGNDVALVKLASKIDFKELGSKVSKVCLPGKSAQPEESKCVVIGWGMTETGQAPMKMREAELPIIPENDCQRQGNYNPANLICGGNGGTGSCYGDSGGPYICPVKGSPDRYLQYGIVSYGGQKCATSPSMFTKVSTYVDWIKQRAEG